MTVIPKHIAPSGAEINGPLGPIYRHLWLIRQVAHSVGVDLSAALHSGDLNAHEYSQLVTACRAGGCDRACMLHMSTLRNGVQDTAHSFCPNAPILDALAAKHPRSKT